MPRAAKTHTRQKINASIAYKRGDREEAYKLWEQAAAGRKEHYKKKHNKKKAVEGEGESSESSE
jgi:hypothetical protein